VRLVELVLARAQHDLRAAFLDAQELIDVLVHLEPDLFAGRDAHHRQLHVLAGEYDRAKRRVVRGGFFDIR
jgi:hypothetical protein